jgi:hypothetical protein
MQNVGFVGAANKLLVGFSGFSLHGTIPVFFCLRLRRVRKSVFYIFTRCAESEVDAIYVAILDLGWEGHYLEERGEWTKDKA